MKILAWKGAKVFGDGFNKSASVVVEFDSPSDEGHRFALFGLSDDDYGLEPIFSHNPLQFFRFEFWDWNEDFNESDEVREQYKARVHSFLQKIGLDEEDSPAAS